MSLFLILKLIHVVFGVLWAGIACTMAVFILPATNAMGPDGGKVMQQIAKTNYYPIVLNTITLGTLLSGFLLYWNLSNGFQQEWIFSRYGILLGIGGFLGLKASLLGFWINLPTIKRMTEIGQTLIKTGSTPGLILELTQLRRKFLLSTRFIAMCVTASILLMEFARYL
ncbi:hypothetical protein [Leptospira stimsonii]|uniref:Copper resistance protein D domain-containing protein n=1 Tax=Leptospira stimsonii TaxID=2202203 RepID=A0A396YPM5_9LEPT|nr:hypothetical protein [Leptospira stimsonii]RHX85091.1 hypothetical protein DLM75_21670 [Leptospira stimsonii]